MQRSLFPILAWGCVLVGACSDPPCPSNTEKVGSACRRLPDAGDDLDDEADMDEVRSHGGDEEGGVRDAGGDVLAKVPPADANVPEVDGGMKQPMSTPEPSAEADASADHTQDAAVIADGAHASAEDAQVSTAADATNTCVASAEVCDGQDNDCDGNVDEEKQTWYCDADGDGFAANATRQVESCDSPPASSSCPDWTTTAPNGVGSQDCDDTTALRFPGAGFGLSAGSSGDLDCNGQIETKIEFVESSIPGFYSSTTPYNICVHKVDDVLGNTAGGECECWLSSAITKGFDGLNGQATGPGGPYFMNTFPCAEELGDVIFLMHAKMLRSECAQEDGVTVAVRQLCR